jgi:hypothetical protein
MCVYVYIDIYARRPLVSSLGVYLSTVYERARARERERERERESEKKREIEITGDM